MTRLFLLFVNIYIAIGDPIIKERRTGILFIWLVRYLDPNVSNSKKSERRKCKNKCHLSIYDKNCHIPGS